MMKPTSLVTIRPAAHLISSTSNTHLQLQCTRFYATQNSLGTTGSESQTRRRVVTPFNDDGRVSWGNLSAGEKAARATQQSFNFGLVIAGLVLTGGVAYFLWTDVFSPESKTVMFNRAVDKIKKDPRCIEQLGDAKKITAHGDETFNKWRRARPIASTERTDNQGNHHLIMHFFVEGPKNNGSVHLHMTKHRDQYDYEYKYLFVQVRGHEKIYLENAETSGGSTGKKALSLFGVKWN